MGFPLKDRDLTGESDIFWRCSSILKPHFKYLKLVLILQCVSVAVRSLARVVLRVAFG